MSTTATPYKHIDFREDGTAIIDGTTMSLALFTDQHIPYPIVTELRVRGTFHFDESRCKA
jgi:hypothetical protein